jgi:hypothetical protein
MHRLVPLLLLLCGCSTSTSSGGPRELGAGGDLSSALDLNVRDAVAADDLAVGDLAVGAGDLAGGDGASLDLVSSDDALGGPCASGGDCPTSGAGGCCATIQTSVDGNTSSPGMCSDSCPVAASGSPGAATLHTKLCVSSGDCGQYYGTIYVTGVPLTEDFSTCCYVAGLPQKFCGRPTIAAYGYYNCN